MRPIVPPPVIMIFFIGIAAGIDVFSPFDLLLREARLPLTAGLLAAGALIAFLGVAEFRKHETTVNPYALDKANALVTGGIFRFTRNPMYLGMLLVVFAAAAFFQDVIGLLAPAGFVVALNRLQIRAEERAMQAHFGEAYTAYCNRTRRWI